VSLPLTAEHRRKVWDGSIVDVDVNIEVPGIEALFPYLEGVWIQHIREQQWPGPSTQYFYPSNMPSSVRDEWRTPDGQVAASSVGLVREHILDRLDVDYAILNCHFPVDGGPPDFSVALARAANDWLLNEWLSADSRLRASLILPGPNDPAAMAAEIDRAGPRPGFVQAFLPARSGKLYGKRLYWPVFEALERNDLVGGIHIGGGNDGLPPTSSGWPSWYVEEYVAEVQVFESQLISLLGEGTFQKFPRLRLAFLGSGFTWVPGWMWNLDRNWKGIRREVPWLKRRPFEVVRDHVRFCTAPMDGGSIAEELALTIKWLGSDDLLMYGTEYPRDHGDSLDLLIGSLIEDMRAKVMSENARDWYRLGSRGR